jgi:hypothetical protein
MELKMQDPSQPIDQEMIINHKSIPPWGTILTIEYISNKAKNIN